MKFSSGKTIKDTNAFISSCNSWLSSSPSGKRGFKNSLIRLSKFSFSILF